MTKESDVFVALRGVALDVSEILEDSLVFGVWTKRILQELAWLRRDHRGSLSVWRAPGWSWASVTGTVCLSSFGDYNHDGVELAELLNVPKETNDPANWQLRAIQLRCRLISLCVLCEHISTPLEPTSMTFNGRVRYNHSRGAQFWFDDWYASDRSEQKTLHCQYLISRNIGQDEDCRLRGILVAPDRRGSALYNRIGFLRLSNTIVDGEWECTASDVLRIFETLKDQEIRLV